MEPFIKVDKDKWPEIRDLFKENLPDSAHVYWLFDMMIAYPGLTQSQVFCPFGDIHNGLICLSDEFNQYELHILPFKDIQKMEEALSTSKLINWTRSIMVPSAGPSVVQCLEKLQTKLGVKVDYDEKCAAINYYLESKCDISRDFTPPPNTYVGPLTPEHISLVDETWTYHGSNSHFFFEKLMKHNLTWVLYSSDDHKPLAWITINTSGALTHLYCLVPHRRKGYAEYITKVAVSDWHDRGRGVIAYTLENNTNPQRLFSKLGFKVIGTDYWLFVNKVPT